MRRVVYAPSHQALTAQEPLRRPKLRSFAGILQRAEVGEPQELSHSRLPLRPTIYFRVDLRVQCELLDGLPFFSIESSTQGGNTVSLRARLGRGFRLRD